MQLFYKFIKIVENCVDLYRRFLLCSQLDSTLSSTLIIALHQFRVNLELITRFVVKFINLSYVHFVFLMKFRTPVGVSWMIILSIPFPVAISWSYPTIHYCTSNLTSNFKKPLKLSRCKWIYYLENFQKFIMLKTDMSYVKQKEVSVKSEKKILHA